MTTGCGAAVIILLTTTLFMSNLDALDNGLALTPPMGWMVWERFRCNVDCVNDPENCISEKLFMEMVDRMVSDGYREAGYEYVCIDDCWLASQRDKNGRLYANTTRFPSGIKKLADYVHSKGLKLGIYQDFGNLTCAGYPGSLGYLETDAQTFADWGVDYLKFDGCNVDPHLISTGYPEMSKALNKTGRPIVFGCEWPLYEQAAGITPNYLAIAATCNLWRNYHDMDDSWDSVVSILNFYAAYQDRFAGVAGPGHWNDPDMLVIGNFGLSYEQAKAQMAMWAILTAPLMMSNDLRSIEPKFKEILLNKDIIAINQDPLGIQGTRVAQQSSIDMWTKPLLNQTYAMAFLSHRYDMPMPVETTLQKMGLKNTSGYQIHDVYQQQDLGIFKMETPLVIKVNPSGVVLLVAS